MRKKAEPIHKAHALGLVLRPSTTSISLRLPVSLLARIELAAHKRHVPYQSLIKTWLAEKVDATDRAGR